MPFISVGVQVPENMKGVILKDIMIFVKLIGFVDFCTVIIVMIILLLYLLYLFGYILFYVTGRTEQYDNVFSCHTSQYSINILDIIDTSSQLHFMINSIIHPV